MSESQPTSPNGPEYAAAVSSARTLAIVSLVFGILGVLTGFCCWLGGLFAIPAIICGHLALGKAKALSLADNTRSLGLVGTITGYIAVLVTICGLLFNVLILQPALENRIEKVFTEINQKLEEEQRRQEAEDAAGGSTPEQP